MKISENLLLALSCLISDRTDPDFRDPAISLENNVQAYINTFSDLLAHELTLLHLLKELYHVPDTFTRFSILRGFLDFYYKDFF